MSGRNVVLALLVFAAAGCARPTAPESPVGMWTLVNVNGAALPAQIVRHIDIVSGSLELKADGSYEESTQTRFPDAVVQTTVRGAWRMAGKNVEFMDRIAGLPFLGRWDGSSLEVQGERAMRYAR